MTMAPSRRSSSSSSPAARPWLLPVGQGWVEEARGAWWGCLNCAPLVVGAAQKGEASLWGFLSGSQSVSRGCRASAGLCWGLQQRGPPDNKS